ncbi:VrrA/YqfQ family protein [Schinkia azotoformans]|uniref:YqfQ-like protein n=1 Tax=Schinkia azotoformans LMG 9581 TaxID=1131731 RepID=K6CQ47_SCHAZ|nr:VrrA/YqfQ family protein [Schinkia azotoformans]EKN62387.1 hypothetical protein BAZO_21168 [Schinkia azotoformans LMG 9581]MEC1640621.1 VrrA/YqfQ family protein [Schinkia azotoformans]MEC1944494.1 VrrA/YqfQ family protein [Schinkia azotoformans]
MHPFRPGNFPMQRPMMPPISRFPMQQMQQGMQQSRGLGGLLSRLLGKGNAPANFGGFPGGGAFPGGGTFLRGGGFPGGLGQGFNPGIGGQLMNGGGSGLSGLMGNFSSGGISGMLNNVQRVMGLAQQVGPMIQQYGPFIKNMPAMFKMMRALNNSDESTETEDSTSTEDSPIAEDGTTAEDFVNEGSTGNKKRSQAIIEKEVPDFDNIKVEPVEKVKLSKPKLYI